MPDNKKTCHVEPVPMARALHRMPDASSITAEKFFVLFCTVNSSCKIKQYTGIAPTAYRNTVLQK